MGRKFPHQISNLKIINKKQTNKQGRSRHQRQCAVTWLSTANADRWSFSTEMANIVSKSQAQPWTYLAVSH